MIQGIGAGFVPDNLETGLIDNLIPITNGEAMETARQLALIEAIPGGISYGAMACAALTLAAQDDVAGKTIVTILPSFAERYQTTPLFDGLDVPE